VGRRRIYSAMKPRKILEKLLSGSLNISFRDFCKLIEAFGFSLSRVRGSHHIFIHPDIHELVTSKTSADRPNRIKFDSS
jgi:predicted RNA binding protein YcfA (HicA-like mRNA interferase family)